MGGIDLPAGAGRTDRAGHAQAVEAGEEPLRIAARQGKVRRVGQTVRRITVETRVRETRTHTGFEFIAQRGNPGHFDRQGQHGQLRSDTQPDDAGNIFGSGAPPRFLAASAQQRRKPQPATHKQGTRAFWSVEFVRRQREEMHGNTREIDRNLAGRLHGIDVENNAPPVGQACHFLNGKKHAGFVVGPDHGDQSGIVTQGGGILRRIRSSPAIDAQPRHLKAFALELRTQIFRGAVLDGRCDDVAFVRLRSQGTANRGGDRFGPAAGKDHRVGGSANQRRHLRARFFHRLARRPSRGMRTRRIAEIFPQKRQHRFPHPRIDRRGRVVVQVDHGKVEGA